MTLAGEGRFVMVDVSLELLEKMLTYRLGTDHPLYCSFLVD